MNLQIQALAARLKADAAAQIDLSDALIDAIKAARRCRIMQGDAEIIMAHCPREFPLFSARQAD
jgi:hypothetical protein